jgi:hypothetical protein
MRGPPDYGNVIPSDPIRSARRGRIIRRPFKYSAWKDLAARPENLSTQYLGVVRVKTSLTAERVTKTNPSELWTLRR